MSGDSEVLDASLYEDDLLRALAVLQNETKEGAEGWLTSAEISNVLLDRHGVSLHWRTIEKLFRDAPEGTATRRRGGRRTFKIVKVGASRLAAQSGGVTIVDPAKGLSAVRGLHQILETLKGPVLVCDPYVDSKSIEHLEAISKPEPIQILTQTISKEGPLRRILAEAQREGFSIDVRRSATNELHDRYIIHATGMLILGTSLNHFGKKQCFVIEVGADIRSTMEAGFTARWAAATPFA